MNAMPLKQLLAEYSDLPEMVGIDIFGLAADHREVKKGDLFFACQGLSVHGKTFIGEAISAGAVAVALEADTPAQLQKVSKAYPAFPIFSIRELTKKLGVIAARFYGYPSKSFPVIGITGTNGKTSCAHLMAQCFNEKKQPCGVIGTLGAGVWGELSDLQHTTPDAIQLQSCLHAIQQKNAAYTVMEVSSHALTQNRVNGCLFDVAVFTNLTRDHLDYHGDMASYGNAKLKLFKRPELTKIVVNLDDPYAHTIIQAVGKTKEIVGITLQENLNVAGIRVIRASDIHFEQQGLSFNVDSPWGKAHLKSQLVGDFNVSNLLTTLAVALLLDFSLPSIIKKLSLAKAPAGRLETFGTDKTPLVVIDYAHTPDALNQVLSTLQYYTNGSLYVLFGCGGDRDKGKRQEMGALAEKTADVVWLTDDNPRTEKSADIIRDILAGIQKPEVVFIEPDRACAIKKIISVASVGDVVLIAGKGHEEYQIINHKKNRFSDRELVAKILEEAA